tara:strand:- start:14370 stop:15629 length:1260 start_codon:yes stop_codon:yes gene_type:complete
MVSHDEAKQGEDDHEGADSAASSPPAAPPVLTTAATAAPSALAPIRQPIQGDSAWLLPHIQQQLTAVEERLKGKIDDAANAQTISAKVDGEIRSRLRSPMSFLPLGLSAFVVAAGLLLGWLQWDRAVLSKAKELNGETKAALQTQLAGITSALGKAQEKVGETHAKFGQIDAEASSLHTRLQTSDADLQKRLERSEEELTAKIQASQEKLKTMKLRVATLSASLQDNADAIASALLKNNPTFKEAMLDQAGAGLSPGIVAAWPTDSALPPGWLECLGGPVPSKYSRLRKALGTTYDPEGLSCLLPDFGGVFLRGSGGNATRLGRPQAASVDPKSLYLSTAPARAKQQHINPTNLEVAGGEHRIPIQPGHREAANGYSQTNNYIHASPCDRTSNRVPDENAETRPKNFSVRWIVYAGGGE